MIAAAQKRGLKVMTVGVHGDDIKLVGGAIDGFAQVIDIAHGGRSYKVKLPLVGAFQVQNAAVAAGLAIATGAEPARVFAALEHLSGAKGRLELAGSSNGAPIFIDYAHKPDALAKALAALRPYASGKLIVVFGAGGDRDAGKRPIMGAHRGARMPTASSSPTTIRAASSRPRSAPPSSPPRRARPRSATAPRRSAPASPRCKPGDVLLIAGKGHETGQIVGDKMLPFSDHDAVARRFAGQGGMSALWTVDDHGGRHARGQVRRAAAPPCPASPSTAARSARATLSSPSRATTATATTSSKARSKPAPGSPSSRATSAAALPPMHRC